MVTTFRPPYLERIRRGVGRLRVDYAARSGAAIDHRLFSCVDNKREVSLPVSLMTTYVALKLTGDPRIEQALADEPVRSAAMKRFLRLARGGMSDALVPFSRSEADLAYAAAMSRSCNSWLFRGEQSRVQAGHFVYRRSRRGPSTIRYIDRHGGFEMQDLGLLDPSIIDDLIQTLKTLRQPLARWVVTDSDGITLDLALSPELAARVQGPPAELTGKNRGVISLVSRSEVRFFAEVRLIERGAVISTAPLSVERWMELQAASIDEAWLLFEHPEFCALGPLPDLFSPGASAIARVEPIDLLTWALGGNELETVNLPCALAVELHRRFHWMSAPHPVLWRALIEATQ
jgi:hypothetical protein